MSADAQAVQIQTPLKPLKATQRSKMLGARTKGTLAAPAIDSGV